MIIKTSKAIPSSEITPEAVFRKRRDFLRAGAVVIGSAASGFLPGEAGAQTAADRELLSARSPVKISNPDSARWWQQKFDGRKDLPASGPFTTDEQLTPFSDVTTYNNFYEFGTDKGDPARNSGKFVSDPWSVEIAGEVGKPGTYALEDLLKPHTLEDRIYRLRCVEAWSMVIPWVGFPLADLIKRFEPTSNAKFVEFQTLVDPKMMPAQSSRFATIDWPYQEGLRMDEAMHPLALLAVGVYGNVLEAPNGAPFRLVVPWKYGFKSIKSIVRINFRADMPNTTWNDLQPREYGFYANVNPQVDHPRWSQATERRLPSTLFKPQRIDTLMFNGYAEQVAGLYEGMNLRRNY
ncbi:MAG: protein-methionine-sulfoxide reductase catalytic subunit MsrP [Pseudomonadales bacterium]|nr:protein-methionine-sulfoxide reductase catalytic subunit MsrP [Pseudomonadales bacterium]